MSFQIKLFSFFLLVYVIRFVISDYKARPNGICYQRMNNNRNTSVCCPNYERAEGSTIRLKCNPICKPSCINGNCVKPGVCYCHIGFKLDPENHNNCVPVCTYGCPNGYCVSPEVCSCNYGYEKVNGVCEPICTEPCRNGVCTAPEFCECNIGYSKSENNICEPYCSTGCNENRYCSAPDICSCKIGWQPDKLRTCQPICNPSCFNGQCVAPYTCQCYDGFEKSKYFGYSMCLPLSTTSTTAAIIDTTSNTASIRWDFVSKSTSEDVTFVESETTVTALLANTVHIMPSSTEENTDVDKTETTYFETTQGIWIYIVPCLALLLLVTLALVVIVRRKQLHSCIKDSYSVEGPQSACTQESFNVTFSSIKLQQEQ